MQASDLQNLCSKSLWISKEMSYSSENNSSPEISVDCIQLIVGTFSNVSLDSFFKIEQDIYIYIIYIYIYFVWFDILKFFLFFFSMCKIGYEADC